MSRFKFILILTVIALARPSQPVLGQHMNPERSFMFYGQQICLSADIPKLLVAESQLEEEVISEFYGNLSNEQFRLIIQMLDSNREKLQLDDWIFYQLIRKTAQQIFPKASSFNNYTLLKWGLLLQTGYDAQLVIRDNLPFLYIRSDELIYNVPIRIYKGKQYVCLNSHDFTGFEKINSAHEELVVNPAQNGKSFSYKITRLPDFTSEVYTDKQLTYDIGGNRFQSIVKVNTDIPKLFINYPVVDYANAFNIPMSRGTYESLIPLLSKHVKGMNQKNGVDYLMNFTRYAFLFEPDEIKYGTEKRLSPEETLFNDQSDCEDRASLFYMLVREIYNLPMVVLVYPKHVSIGVAFDLPFGTTIRHKGRLYTICEPTPQKKHLKIGETLPGLHDRRYDIAFDYLPETLR